MSGFSGLITDGRFVKISNKFEKIAEIKVQWETIILLEVKTSLCEKWEIFSLF